MALSLRSRLNLVFNLLLLLVALGGGIQAVLAARAAVAEELRSTSTLAQELLHIVLENPRLGASAPGSAEMRTVLQHLEQHLGASERTRHLDLEVRDSAQALVTRSISAIAKPGLAPRWFVRLVEPPAETLALAMPAGRRGDLELIVRANPSDEIDEAWLEFRSTLVLFAVLAVLANVVVYLLVGWSLRPVDAIAAGIDAIGQGDYQHRLHPPDLPELGRIATRVNRLADALDRAREQNRNLTRRSLAIQEDERRRLAHELHDEMGQSISAIKAVAVSIAQRAEAQQPALSARARTIAEVATAVHNTVRTMMHRLRPVVLDEIGLASAVEQLVDEWNAHHADTFCALQILGTFDDLSDAEEISVFRIIQEALTNVAKHARAGRVDIELARSTPGGNIRLRIRDDGVGFDPARHPRGLGLLGMEERVTAVGGSFALHTTPGGGTRIEIGIPHTTERVSA